MCCSGARRRRGRRRLSAFTALRRASGIALAADAADTVVVGPGVVPLVPLLSLDSDDDDDAVFFSSPVLLLLPLLLPLGMIAGGPMNRK